eukprot:47129-Eustigmatos_ZCMA.PRE.1
MSGSAAAPLQSVSPTSWRLSAMLHGHQKVEPEHRPADATFELQCTVLLQLLVLRMRGDCVHALWGMASGFAFAGCWGQCTRMATPAAELA